MHFVNYGICIVTLAKVTVRIIERIDISPPTVRIIERIDISPPSSELLSELTFPRPQTYRWVLDRSSSPPSCSWVCLKRLLQLVDYSAFTIILLCKGHVWDSINIFVLWRLPVFCPLSRHVLYVFFPLSRQCTVLSLCHWYMYCVCLLPPFQLDMCCQYLTDTGTVCLLPPFQVDVCCLCVTDTCTVCMSSSPLSR